MSAGWALVGRAEQLARGRAALTGAAGGVVLCGAAGVGKTRLATEIVAGVRDHRVVAWSVGTRSIGGVPFGAFAHLLPAGPMDTTSALDVVRRVHAEVRRRSPGAPLVLAVDDAHLLDEPSAGLLHHLAATRAASVVVTVRDGSPVHEPVRALWTGGLADRVDLPPLSGADAAALLADALGGQVDPATAYRLWRGSGGNALFLRELILLGLADGRLANAGGVWRWHGALAGGARLTELVDDRLGGLTAVERDALELLAVAEPLPRRLLDQAVGTEVTSRLEGKDLLDVTHDMVSTAHPLFGESLRSRIGPLRRKAVHRRLANAAGQDPGVDILRRALWQVDGGGPVDSATLVAAARQAIGLFDHPLGERLARCALDAGAGPEAVILLAESLLWQARHDECGDALDALDPGSLDGATLAAWAYCAGTNAFWGLGDAEAAEALLVAAEERLRPGDDRDRLTGQRAVVLFYSGRAADAVVATGAVVHRPDAGVVARTVVSGAFVVASAAHGATGAAITLADRRLGELGPLLGENPFLLSELHGGLGLARWMAGRFTEMEAACAVAYQQTVEARAHDFRGFVACQLGRAHLGRGMLPAARARLREATVALRSIDVLGVLPLALAWLARSAVALGAVAEARAALDECAQRWLPAMVFYDTDIILGRAWLDAAQGRSTSANLLALDAAERASRRGYGPLELEALHEAVRLGRRGLSGRLTAVNRRVENILGPTFVAHACALDTSDPATALDDVAARFADAGCPLLAAEASVESAEAHAVAGRRGSRLAALRRAHRWAAECGQPRTPVLLRLHQAPQTVQLTPREREIADLAGAGLSNRAIAERLSLSVRTVDNHLGHAYQKLGVAGRAGLRDLLGRRDGSGADGRQDPNSP